MRIAFYAPMKPASSPVPSGDREMARNLIAALQRHHDVDVASEFVSRDGTGDPAVQKDLAIRAQNEARMLIDKWQSGGFGGRPDAWFTYHVYHKAPDWIGPAVSDTLQIPYFVAEVSHAPKQAGGPWDTGYRAAEAAIKSARGVIGLSELDAACVLPLLDDPGRYHKLAPFTDISPFAEAADNRNSHRREIAGRFGLSLQEPTLLAVGMMRDGDKLGSYRVLADALSKLRSRKWNLLIVGDGPARPAVEDAFSGFPAGHVTFAGAADLGDLPEYYAAADVMVWPAVNEAYGMAMLEAQATGLPVVAGNTGGVPEVVRHRESGILCPVGDADAFADAVDRMLSAPDMLDAFSSAARARTSAENNIQAASDTLDRILRGVRKARAA
ncbi:MAG: glycosyltransferase family 4 protein [Alphaproteobacteria bacterium]